MDKCGRVGERRIRFVMVRDDQGDAAFLGHLGLVNAGDSTIDRDDDVRLLLRRDASYGRFVQAVPLLGSAGQVVVDLCPQQGQPSLENGGAGHTVDVVIAVHDDVFPGLNRVMQNFGGLHTAGKTFRLVEKFELGVEKLRH